MENSTGKKIKAGIAGGAGYTGGELLRLLLRHPAVEIAFVHSRSNAGRPVWEVHTDLLGDTSLAFTDEIVPEVDVLFLCVGHGEDKNYPVSASTRLIDLSQDFRIRPGNFMGEREFVYGLPELNRDLIRSARNIANPGCFATAIQLALLPLLQSDLVNGEVFVSATTGSTGAGQTPGLTSHFSWRESNLSVYKAYTHQHLGEIANNLGGPLEDGRARISFVPQRGAFTRGILASVSLQCTASEAEITSLFTDFYATHPFVFISPRNIDLKQVVNTNKCLLYLEKQADRLLVVSIIDNLLKGASGQAVQNMNLMFGLEENAGLQLKAAAF